MSGAPIISGRTKFARPANAGTITRKISSAACTEKSPLKVCGSTTCIPGRASSARITSASIPPTSRKNRFVPRYWTPITLWSVLTLK